MKGLVLSALLGTAAAQSGKLVGVFVPSGNALSDLALMGIDVMTAENSTIAQVSLGNLAQTFPAKSAYDDGMVVVAAATSDAVWGFDPLTGKATTVAPLPPYNESDPFLGLVIVNKQTFLVTQNGLWSVADGAVTLLTQLDGFPGNAQTCADPSAGTGGAGMIYVGDTDSPVIYTIDLGDSYAVSSIKTSISALWDLQYSSYLGQLIAVAGYQMYTINPTSGKQSKRMSIVDGPGYPKVNAVSPDGRYFAFFDFSNLHVIDLSTNKYVAQGPFIGAPRAVGFPVWVPTA